MGTLYIVPTPIGNLEDITLRALRVLREVALIAAEDTRTTRKLLRHYAIDTALTSYHEHNKLVKLDAIFAALATGAVALVSDAGTPGISDPGYELVRAALARGIRVEPLPGATALIPALVASGLPTDEFVYLGFLPKKRKARRDALERIKGEQRTLVAYESPNRLLEALEDVHDVLGDRPVCVAREVSKLYEEFQRGDVSDVLAYYRDTPPRGEIVLVIGGASSADTLWDAEQIRAALRTRLAAGEGLNAAAKAIARESGWNKGDVYRIGVEMMD
ncbi:MAG: 16S rRNA (cytidine(1402)-2'-O)-methyltransferase [Chloroflexi bacterium]|nr:MAG: 16S rRNA (cytidine(1402)-2'-O)-methyltransferase [Chloroflexota bacterium]